MLNIHSERSAQKAIVAAGLTLVLLLAVFMSIPAVKAANDDCADADGYGFVCGAMNAEDLVLVPGTKWIISSGMVQGAAIYLIDSENDTWQGLYPGEAPRAVQNMSLYGACPGTPDPGNFITHGLNLRAGENNHSTLYAVSHGGREAIEVFDVDASGSKPALTWIGCVLMPEGLDANSVASFSDGTLLATVLILPGFTFADTVRGRDTGAVYSWSPGDAGFEVIQGTGLPANNGIEVSADETEFFVVSSGLNTITAFSRTNPARKLRSTRRMSFTPDNVHMDSNGRLITAGMVDNDPVCGTMTDPEAFDLEKIAACPRPFIAKAIDPQTMEDSDLVRGPATPNFSNATMALQTGNKVWIGTFSGSRLAYRLLE